MEGFDESDVINVICGQKNRCHIFIKRNRSTAIQIKIEKIGGEIACHFRIIFQGLEKFFVSDVAVAIDIDFIKNLLMLIKLILADMLRDNLKKDGTDNNW